MRVDFFFDPSCPWCWATSRMLVEVAPQRDLDMHWRSFSLLEKNRLNPDPAHVVAHRFSHASLRVAESLREEAGEEGVGALYTEVGARIHHDLAENIDLADVLGSIGAAGRHAGAATDQSWDRVITASMDEAMALAGGDIGVPCIAYDQKAAFFGPVITPAPTGTAALELFDALATMAGLDGFFELKRTRDREPAFGARPATPRIQAAAAPSGG